MGMGAVDPPGGLDPPGSGVMRVSGRRRLFGVLTGLYPIASLPPPGGAGGGPPLLELAGTSGGLLPS